MADFVAILEKAVQSLPDNSAQRRAAVFSKARLTIERKLRSIEPPASEEAIARQMAMLEQAIATVEARHGNAGAVSAAAGPAGEGSGEPAEAAAGTGPSQAPAQTAASAPSARLPRSAGEGPASADLPATSPVSPPEPASVPQTEAAPTAVPPVSPATVAPSTDPISEPVPEPAPEPTPEPAPEPAPEPPAAAEPPEALDPFYTPPTEAPAAYGSAPAAVAHGSQGYPSPDAGSYPPARTAEPSMPADEPAFISHLDGDPAIPPPLAGSGPRRQRSGGAGKWIAGSLLVLLIGGAAGAYVFRDDLTRAGGVVGEAVQALFGSSGQSAPAPAGGEAAGGEAPRLGSDTQGEQAQVSEQPVREVTPPAEEEPAASAPAADGGEDVSAPAAEAPSETAEAPAAPAAEEAATAADDSQSLQPEGEQLSAEPAGGETAPPPAVESISGETAYLYEEAAGAAGASRDEAFVNWRIENQPPSAGMAPEPVIVGQMEVPGRGLTLLVSIKRNVDEALPASHLIELIFSAPPEFTGGNVDDVSRFVMKASEQARGESLIGVPARIDTGLFLIALNNLAQAQETNRRLLESAEWIDIPVSYANGRRALVTLEKGPSGREIFANALADWQNRQ